MEVDGLKQSVLMNLRSVILSCKGGVPLNRLQSDYKLLIGSTVPFTSLGYNSLETFLQSIPQVIKLKKNSEGQVIVEAVVDSSTAHLQNLISKQKSTKTQKCSVKTHVKKPASKPKSSQCTNCTSTKSASTLRNANSTGAHSSASSSWSIDNEIFFDYIREIKALESKLEEQKMINSVLESRVNELEEEPNLEDEIQRMKCQTWVQSPTSLSWSIANKEIKALKSKLEKQTKINSVLESRVNQLVSEGEPNLEDEQVIVQRIKCQIGLLQKRLLLQHSASPEALKVNRHINEIVEQIKNLTIMIEKLSPNLTNVNSKAEPVGDTHQAPEYDPFQLYHQQCKETEELKKQLQLQNSQMQSIEKRMQIQLQKLQSQIKNDPPPIPSNEQIKSELAEDLENQLQEQNSKIEMIEKRMQSRAHNLQCQIKIINKSLSTPPKVQIESEFQKLQSQIGNDPSPIPSYEQIKSELAEGLKNQLQEYNSRIEMIEKRMQSQVQNLQCQIRIINKSLSTPSKVQIESELMEGLLCPLQEQIEKNIALEFSKLKARVEYCVHLICESEKQKSKNKVVDAIDTKSIIDKLIEELLSRNLITDPKVSSTSENSGKYVPPHRRTQPNKEMPDVDSSQTNGATKTSKKKKKRTGKKSEIRFHVDTNGTIFDSLYFYDPLANGASPLANGASVSER